MRQHVGGVSIRITVKQNVRPSCIPQLVVCGLILLVGGHSFGKTYFIGGVASPEAVKEVVPNFLTETNSCVCCQCWETALANVFAFWDDHKFSWVGPWEKLLPGSDGNEIFSSGFTKATEDLFQLFHESTGKSCDSGATPSEIKDAAEAYTNALLNYEFEFTLYNSFFFLDFGFFTQVVNEIDEGRPCVLHYDTGIITAHAVMVVGYDDGDETFYVFDPNESGAATKLDLGWWQNPGLVTIMPGGQDCETGICCSEGFYTPAPTPCQLNIEEEYFCPWGTSCGANVGHRAKHKYCSGESHYCDGDIGPWVVSAEPADTCGSEEVCVPGIKTCQFSADCIDFDPWCGDDQCNGDEDCESCPSDCDCEGYCGDKICNNGETCQTCTDCKCGVDCPCPASVGVRSIKVNRKPCSPSVTALSLLYHRHNNGIVDWYGEFNGGNGRYIQQYAPLEDNNFELVIRKTSADQPWTCKWETNGTGLHEKPVPGGVDICIPSVPKSYLEGTWEVWVDNDSVVFDLEWFDCASDCPGLCDGKCGSVPPCECSMDCGCGKECADNLCVGDPCEDVQCGQDVAGCGIDCGECPQGLVCNDEHKCDCIPDCEDKVCGGDGCGGICGECEKHYVCEDGACVYEPYCGDINCDPSEDCSVCESDCGDCCGNNVCDEALGESCQDCPVDCGECCPNGNCQPWYQESCASCPQDCGDCCPNQSCESWLGEDCQSCTEDCGECCGNGICDEDKGETCGDCPEDCGECPTVCGEDGCEMGEDCFSCADDCGDCCGDGECKEEHEENCFNCEPDCGKCCGDAQCETKFGETCFNCEQDCDACCGDGQCQPDFEETCEECPQDCGVCPECGNGVLEAAEGEECDDANKLDGDGCSADCKLEVVKEGSVIVTEIMKNPEAVGDGKSEWFELYNREPFKVDVNGWVLEDQDSDQHIIDNGAPLWIESGGYLVLGINADPATNGGVAVDYEYSNFNLANADDEVILGIQDQFTVDQVFYEDDTFPDVAGASLSLDGQYLDHHQNDVGPNWCACKTMMGSGDFGTPGAPNDSCFGYCGDGVMEPETEQCDDGNANSDVLANACRTDCKLPSCGDGVVDSGEQCDDGNNEPGDDCSETCQDEVVDPVCGNGVVEAGEECDDGNAEPGDGCDENCEIEPGVPVCGNGIVDPEEECDDGNTEGGDGCSADCEIEEVEPGDIIIAEIMKNPDAVSDAEGEWFEVRNMSSFAIDMNDWVLEDAGSDQHVIDNGGPLWIEAGNCLVFGINADPATNGGVDLDYEYFNFNLGNKDDEIALRQAGTAVEIDLVSYLEDSFPGVPGRSISLDPGAYDHVLNDDAANWCAAADQDVLPSGDFGTPGQVNGSCTGSTCGNGECEEGETCSICPADCTEGCCVPECTLGNKGCVDDAVAWSCLANDEGCEVKVEQPCGAGEICVDGECTTGPVDIVEPVPDVVGQDTVEFDVTVDPSGEVATSTDLGSAQEVASDNGGGFNADQTVGPDQNGSGAPDGPSDSAAVDAVQPGKKKGGGCMVGEQAAPSALWLLLSVLAFAMALRRRGFLL